MNTLHDSDCRLILAMIADDDLTGEFGTFIVRRIEQIRNKPMTAEVDLDVL